MQLSAQSSWLPGCLPRQTSGHPTVGPSASRAFARVSLSSGFGNDPNAYREALFSRALIPVIACSLPWDISPDMHAAFITGIAYLCINAVNVPLLGSPAILAIQETLLAPAVQEQWLVQLVGLLQGLSLCVP